MKEILSRGGGGGLVVSLRVLHFGRRDSSSNPDHVQAKFEKTEKEAKDGQF